MGNENPQPTINMLRMGGVPDVKLLAVTAKVKWTVVGQPLQFIEYTATLFRGSNQKESSVLNKLFLFSCSSMVEQSADNR
jgi:hypothetical protein